MKWLSSWLGFDRLFETVDMRALWIVLFFGTLVWSAINPKDYTIWLLEVFPAMLGAGVLAATYRSFRLTGLVYGLILLHCIVLMIGGHYTYAEVPLFDSVREWLGFQRNNYDKIGHFLQGFVPVLVAREIFIRKAIVVPGGWLNFLAVCFCLAFSAFYELIEWQVALFSDEAADAFLGTQGYIWDTQSDMGFALVGAVLAIVFLGRVHDRQILKLSETS